MHQHMSALDVATRCFVRLSAEPAIVWAGGHCYLSCHAKLRIERVADVVDEDVLVLRQSPCSGKQDSGRFFLTQMTDHEGAQVARRLDQLPTRRGRLENDTRLRMQFRSQHQRAALLQDHQSLGKPQRSLRRGIALDIAIKIRTRQDHRQPRSVGLVPCRDGGRRAPRVQGKHDVVSCSCGIRPLPNNPCWKARREKTLPPARSLPVAVVGICERRAHNHDLC